ncbi:MAG: hypothetical protein HZA77_05970 [Candidatus Schekmanbacteria bacterium]|nr:hypothetical protein [Candidatus Schekmanbacteria bacterium]
MKPIRLSNHSKLQMLLRCATEEEVKLSIHESTWAKAKMGKFQTKKQFSFNKMSPTNNQFYKYKTVEPIFADEQNEIVVITVKVYYSNQEVKS